jgi:hypothetical protein
VCEGPLVSLGILEDWTDRGPDPADRPLTVEVLVGLVALVVALGGSGAGEGDR